MSIRLLRPSPGVITSPYGWRTPGKVGSTFHEGIDFGWGNGWTITAAAAGRVIHMGRLGGYGNLTRIDHGGGYETRYAHQSKFLASLGESVSAGEQIGVIGNTGTSNGPHLHFELLINGRKVDPAPYFSSTAGGGLTPIFEEEEDSMEPKIVGHKDQEVAVLAPWLPNGFLTAKLDTQIALGWSRLYSPTKDGLVPMYERDVYLGMIASATALAAGYQAALPKPGGVGGSTDLGPMTAAIAEVDKKVSAIPTAEQNAQATRAEMIVEK